MNGVHLRSKIKHRGNVLMFLLGMPRDTVDSSFVWFTKEEEYKWIEVAATQGTG
jgi:hypothetical protein